MTFRRISVAGACYLAAGVAWSTPDALAQRGVWSVSCTTGTSGGPPLPTDNRGSYDIATLAIFPEYVEFDAAEVLQFVVPVPAGRRPA